MDKTWEIVLTVIFMAVALPILFRLPLTCQPPKDENGQRRKVRRQ
jgi:hypothetical protein